MKHRLLFITTLSYIFISELTLAQPVIEFPQMIDELVLELKEANVSQRKIRLAVLPLVPTGGTISPVQDKFGAYFAESLTSESTEGTDKFKLYERSRLDAILKEVSLEQSGVVDAGTAVKIGELAPIDVIFSGTYTRLSKKVSIHGRLIDVVSGEILLTYGQDVILDDDLIKLFLVQEAAKAEDPCKRIENQCKELLNDLSTPEKIEQVIQFAGQVPFDLNCGKIHFTLMFTFKRYKIENDTYRLFLLNTLKQIEYPGNDDRALSIIKYLGKDGQIDEEEWETGLNCASRVGNRFISSYLHALLLPNEPETDEELVLDRSRIYLDRAAAGKVGLPVAISFDMAFFELMDAFNYIYAKDNRYIYPIFLEYENRLASGEKSLKKINSLLYKMYWREADSEKRQDLLNRIAENYSQRQIDDKVAGDLYGFARDLEVKGTGNYTHDDAIPAPSGHLKIFIDSCVPLFCTGLQVSKFRSQTEDRQNFCLKYSIVCPGVIPTVEECLAMLDSDQSSERDRAAELIVKMGPSAAAAEVKMISILEKSGVADNRYSRKVRQEGIIFLGRLETKNSRTINVLCECLASTEYKIPDYASDALVQIGKPAVPKLSEKLFDRFGSVQYKSAVILGRIGKDAIGAKGDLEKVLKTTNNSAVHSAAKEALRQIMGE